MSARVKHFLSALLYALKEERHFALMDGVAFPTVGSLVHAAAGVSWSVAIVRQHIGIAHCRAFQCPGHCRSRVAACCGTGAGFALARSSGRLESSRCRESGAAVSPPYVSRQSRPVRLWPGDTRSTPTFFADLRQGRSDQGSLPCSTQPRSPSRTPPSSRRSHRLLRALGAGSSNRRRDRRACQST
jgi:hypothetical protein